MPPSFHDPSSSPSFLPAGAPKSTSTSQTRLPTLAIVLGIIGILLLVIFVAGLCIYIFRGRLFPSVGPANVEEKHSEVKEDTRIFDRTFSDFADDDVLMRNKPEEPKLKRPTLRPFLLNPVRPVRAQYKQLRLPRLQQTQEHQAGSRPKTRTRKCHSLPYCPGRLDVGRVSTENAVGPASLKVSQSCPAGLEPIEAAPNIVYAPEDVDVQCTSILGVLTLVKKFSPPLPSISSSDSTDSVHSQDSSSSSSTSPYWDDYINNPPADLFYKPDPESLPPQIESASVLQVGACPLPIEATDGTEDSSMELQLKSQQEIPPKPFVDSPTMSILSNAIGCNSLVIVSKRASSMITSRRRPTVSHVRTRRAKSQGAIRSMKRRMLRFRTIRSTPLRPDLLEFTESICSDPSGEPGYETFYQNSTEVPTIWSPVVKLDTQFGTLDPSAITFSNEIPSPLHAKQSPSKIVTTSPPHTRPTLQLNGVPADEAAFNTPRRFNRQRSPPRNPALLNTRWMPRPAPPPLTITVFARDRSTTALKYPGRRLTFTPPAGASLADLRSSVERALGHEVRALRGMVFIGKRSMFLPLLSERFYAQWVKERIREGRVGIVEAWHHGRSSSTFAPRT